MAETLTSNYKWTKPDPGASANTWGATLNATTDKIDTQVFTNGLAGVPVGAIMMWGAAAPPANWLICNGTMIDATIYAKLFAVIGNTFGGVGAQGNFVLPNLINRFPFGGNGGNGLAATGGEVNHTLTAAEMPVHNHNITDVAHNHTLTDPTHTHTINQSVHGHGDPTHTHGASAYQDAHWHDLDHNVASNFSGGNVQAGTGWAFGDVNTVASQPAVHVAVDGAATGIQPNLANVSNAYAGTGITIGASGALIYGTNNAGSGGAHNNLPPYLIINFIIKYQ